MFRKPRFIILSAIAFYAIALLVTWHQIDMRADRRRDIMLEAAERGYSEVINGEIDAALRNVGGAIVKVLGGKCAPQTLKRMQELAKTLNIDEVNVVNREGIVIGSNLRSVLGFDFKSNPLTREFMALTNATTTIVTQPFRTGVANPEMFCRYHGMAFPDHDGFIQLGMTVGSLRQNMYSYSPEEADRILKDWHFSVVGWYERADADPAFASGRMFRRWSEEHGEMVIGRYFDYRGYRYAAFLPKSYCYSQRNAAFAVTAVVLGILLFIFVYVLVRLAKTSANLRRCTLRQVRGRRRTCRSRRRYRCRRCHRPTARSWSAWSSLSPRNAVRPARSAATSTTFSTCRPGGWPSWSRTFRARAFPGRCS